MVGALTHPSNRCNCGKIKLSIGKAEPFCAFCDRIKCGCGFRLWQGSEERCPNCGKDVRLANRLP